MAVAAFESQDRRRVQRPSLTMAYNFHTRAALSGDDGAPSQAVPPLTSLHQGGVMIKGGPNVVLPDWYTPYPQGFPTCDPQASDDIVSCRL